MRRLCWVFLEYAVGWYAGHVFATCAHRRQDLLRLAANKPSTPREHPRAAAELESWQASCLIERQTIIGMRLFEQYARVEVSELVRVVYELCQQVLPAIHLFTNVGN